MVLLRSAALRRPLTQRLTASTRSTVRAAERPSWQQIAGRRGYADAHGAIKQAGSDLPWMIGAVVVTVPSLFYLLQPRSDAHHGEADEADHGDHAAPDSKEGDAEESSDEKGAEEEKPAEDSKEKSEDTPKPESEGEEKKEEAKDESEAKDDSEAKDEKKGEENKGDGEKGSEEKSDSGKDDDTKSEDSEGKDSEGAKPKADQIKGERKKEPSPKSDTGEKRRIDSALRKPQGVAGDTSQISDAQEHLSNAPTMHSTDQMKNPEQSKKPEGAPDTAKLTGPVDPKR